MTLSRERLISVVLLEDDDLDAELIHERLLAAGLPIDLHRATTEAEFVAALKRGSTDLILSDFSLPGYDGLAALHSARATLPDVPFIFVSGAIGEERAIDTLQRGADDYVLKNRLARLPSAVARALNLADERQKRREAERERDLLLVSERQAREAAEAANRMKDEFLAVVSHELRTPLNAILGWASLLATGDSKPEALAKGLATIERNARAQARLIEDILDISRIVTGKLQLRTTQVPVVAFVSAAVEAVRPALNAKHIDFELELTGAGEIEGDADRLQQIVWNLLSNAAKFTPAGGQVALHAERTEESVAISVSDTGAGIEPSFLPYVFERFRQGDATATRRHGGLGLGLAIVRHLAELHGGTVRAESEGLGLGARFVVQLPTGAPVSDEVQFPSLRPPSLLPMAASEPPLASLTGIHALVVDDELDTRELVAFVLRSSGARITTASTVADALALVREQLPDIIISDIGMPEVDGYSLVRKLRALPPEAGGKIPAIALTAYARELDQREARRAGYQRHLAKPVAPAVLVAAVAEVAAAARALH